ncbi:hypothetical protein CDIK_1574 [Cucumispora dikerogammari]|nr:hypothetical protein CDIK_1574 [Cucumispora dikerogammari]
MDNGLLKKAWRCFFCRKPMVLTPHQREDGWIWVCYKSKCKRHKKSVRSVSFLSGLKLPLFKVIMIIYEWSQQIIIRRIKHEYDVEWKAINAVISVIRRVIMPKKIVKIGEIGEIVEVIVAALSRRKNNKGRVVKTLWCSGKISRETKKIFVDLTIHKDMINFDKILVKHVELDTLIFTDHWSNYLNLSNIGYLHERVNHSRNFLNPDYKSIHTQSIESQ